MRKLTATAVILILIMGLSGCRAGGGLPEDIGDQSVPGRSAWNGEKYDPPITLTRVVKHNTYSTTFRDNEDWDDNVFTRWLEDTLGMKTETLWAIPEENHAFSKKLLLSISRGEALPDIVSYRGSYETMMQLMESGRFMPVDELFDKYANDIWKEAAASYPQMWENVTIGGKKYALPLLDYTMNTEPVLWIREDWLEKLDLDPPETIEDLERIMEAFTYLDPDGNGKDDTYGLAVTLRENLNAWMTDLSWLFGAYGAVNSQWNKVGDRLEYGSVQPAAKQALGKLSEWMKKGYIARDASTWDEVKASELFTTGKAGIIAGPHWLPDWPFPKLKSYAPEAKYRAFPVPAGPEGKRGVRAGSPAPTNGVILINKDSEHPEAFLHYYNYLMEHYANPAEGSPFEYGFAKGYDYDLINGKLVKDNPQFISPMDYSLSYEGARIPELMINTLVKLATEEPTTPFEQQVKAKRRPEEIEAASIVMDYDRQGIRYHNWYSGRSLGIAKSRSSLLVQMEREAFNKIIYGQLPVDAFDQFVEQWRQAGGDELTEQVNNAYQLSKNER
ncbi:extracellular solute-binding protein [Paenibacillus sp. GCM10012307]|uniref:Extracellular solute-binding protein n=1 Tax=Paenibacillus roseus TaxID=2798579 RepID=A0A934J6S4_9BACL|nr:extracellular solute-binding protein [Paenibacillus roseus]MBJ6363945.1 extracellular solute-binding protein [Paenibacillus roseus]